MPYLTRLERTLISPRRVRLSVHVSREPILSRPFALVWAAHFAFATSVCVMMHFPGFLRRHGASEPEIGIVAATLSLSALLIRPLVGRWIDRHGRGRTLRLGLAAHTIVCALYLALGRFGPEVFVVRALHGTALAASASVLFALAADLVPASRRTEGLAVFAISGMLPLGLGTVLGEFLLQAGDYPLLFAASTGLSLLGWLCALPIRSVPAAAGPERPRGVLGVFASPSLTGIWAAGIGFTLANASLGTFLKTYVLSTGVGTIGHFFGVYAAVAVATRIVIGWVPDRVGPSRVVYPAAASTILGFILVARSSSEANLMVAAAFGGMGHAFMFPVLVSLLVSRTNTTERGAAMAAYTALSDFGALVGAPLFGTIIHLSNYPVAFGAAAGMLGLAMVVFAVGERRLRSQHLGTSQ